MVPFSFMTMMNHYWTGGLTAWSITKSVFNNITNPGPNPHPALQSSPSSLERESPGSGRVEGETGDDLFVLKDERGFVSHRPAQGGEEGLKIYLR